MLWFEETCIRCNLDSCSWFVLVWVFPGFWWFLLTDLRLILQGIKAGQALIPPWHTHLTTHLNYIWSVWERGTNWTRIPKDRTNANVISRASKDQLGGSVVARADIWYIGFSLNENFGGSKIAQFQDTQMRIKKLQENGMIRYHY